MIYLSLRWETKIGEVNKNLTLIWRAIRTAKMNNEVIRRAIIRSLKVKPLYSLMIQIRRCIQINLSGDMSLIFTNNKTRVEMLTH